MTFHADVAASAADDESLVAIIAERLVDRQAHEEVGRLVGEAQRSGTSLRDAVAASERFSGCADLFAPGASLNARRSAGGSGPAAREAQGERLRVGIARARERVNG
jgi:argininosuccinate lyase